MGSAARRDRPLVEAVEAEVAGVDHVGRAVQGQVGGGAGDAGAPHHPVAAGGGHRRTVDPLLVAGAPGPTSSGPRIGRWSGVKSMVAAQVLAQPEPSPIAGTSVATRSRIFS